MPRPPRPIMPNMPPRRPPPPGPPPCAFAAPAVMTDRTVRATTAPITVLLIRFPPRPHGAIDERSAARPSLRGRLRRVCRRVRRWGVRSRGGYQNVAVGGRVGRRAVRAGFGLADLAELVLRFGLEQALGVGAQGLGLLVVANDARRQEHQELRLVVVLLCRFEKVAQDRDV